MLKDNQKFFAFVLLIVAVLALGGISILVDALTKDGQQTDPTVLQAKLTILNIAMGGLIGAVGAASQAFFRTSQADQDTAAAMKSMAESLPPAPNLPTGGTTTTTTTVAPTPDPATDPAPKSATDAANQVADAASDEANKIAGAGK